MSERYRLERGQKFLACVWQTGPSYMVLTKGFKELEAARRWARRIFEVGTISVKDGNKTKTVGVLEIGILTKDKSNKKWPWAEVERHKNPEIERIKQAQRRAADEAKGTRR